jgi:NADH-quinone oxidoreductase subunit C
MFAFEHKIVNDLFNKLVYLEISSDFLCSEFNPNYSHITVKNKNLFSNDMFFDSLKFSKQFSEISCRLAIDLTAVDCLSLSSYNENFGRFNVYYNLASLRGFRFIFGLNTQEEIKSAESIFNSFSWLEREVWDMFGIYISNNNDLRRILTDYGFRGHPLRKDFPVIGFNELSYNGEVTSVIYQTLSLQQEYRKFDIVSGWQNYIRETDPIIY